MRLRSIAFELADMLRRICEGLRAASSTVIQSTHGWLPRMMIHARDAAVAVRIAILQIAVAVRMLCRIREGLRAASSTVIQSTHGWLKQMLMHARDAAVAVRIAILKIAVAVSSVILQIAFAVRWAIFVNIDRAVFFACTAALQHVHLTFLEDKRYDMWQDSLKGVFAKSSGALF